MRDACFCFPCGKYVHGNEKDVTFTLRGFNNWKTALERDKGLHKHASSQTHIKAAATWSEHKCREATGETIGILVGKTQIEKNHYYVKSIGEVVKFLCVNELGLRGTTEKLKCGTNTFTDVASASGDNIAGGLFFKLFEYTLEKDEKLADIAKGIPKNATCTSHNIQNEIIETLANMVLEETRNKYANADSVGFCLKSDGTRDRCNIENLSIMIRFVCNSVPEEHLIGLLDLHQLDAEYMCNEILSHLSDAGYSADNIVSQCYDGASVMSGVRGGVQAPMQKLARYIPYIHCYSHQLHLVVVHAMQDEPCAKNFFSPSNSLYNFCCHYYVSQKYDAPCLKRLLEIRWTSHYDVTSCIVENENRLLNILSEISEDDDDCPVDLCTEASGLLIQIKRHNFFEIGKFLVQVLAVLQPANKILQSQSVDMCRAGEVVCASLESLKEIHKDDCWTELSQAPAGDDSHPPKRKRTLSKHLGQSVVLSTVGHTDCDNSTITPSQSLKRSLLNILDKDISEMEDRFSQKNVDVMTAVSSLAPKSTAFLNATLLRPLYVLAGIVADDGSLNNEILVAKPLLLKKCPNEEDLSTLCKHLNEYKEAFPELHKLYVTVLVLGVSSASCESSFSTLSRVLTPFRRTMLHERKRNLVILAHEKAITNTLDMDEFVQVFAKGNRRLML